MDENRPPWWYVFYTLDGHPEKWATRAESAEKAAWLAALDLSDRGFGDRVNLISVGARNGG